MPETSAEKRAGGNRSGNRYDEQEEKARGFHGVLQRLCEKYRLLTDSTPLFVFVKYYFCGYDFMSKRRNVSARSRQTRGEKW